MRKLTLLSFALIVFFSRVSMAESDLRSGHQLVNSCSKYVMFHKNKHLGNKAINFESVDYLEAGRCMGFMTAFLDTHRFVNLIQNWDEVSVNAKGEEDISLFCVPANISYLSQTELLLNQLYLRAEKDRAELDKPASLLALEIFSEKFPCKSRHAEISQNSKKS